MVTRVWGVLTLGLLCVVLGALWIFEGLGYVAGSSFTRHSNWAVAGGVVLFAGLLLIALGVRTRDRLRPPTPAPAGPDDLPITEQPTSVSLPPIRADLTPPAPQRPRF